MTLKRNENEMYNEAKNNINMHNLGEIIKKHNYTITKVSMNTGINNSTLYQYLSNTLTPSLPNLINLANFLQCNLDYLIGRTNNPNLYDNYNSNEVNSIIHMIKLLTKEEQKVINILVNGLIKEKEKINN